VPPPLPQKPHDYICSGCKNMVSKNVRFLLGHPVVCPHLALNLGGTGISPADSFSYRSSFRIRSRFRSRSNFRYSFSFSFSFSFRSRYPSNFRSRSSSSSTTSGDIFYCSGSRQLNHSSYYHCEYGNFRKFLFL